ncbi:MAG TPA: DNA repair protein RecN [Polyangiaceae bacterium]
MLVQLSAQNLVLIEQIALEPGAGFNVLTGETGAGKSMLVDALGLVLGARARPDLVRNGQEEATVEALFEIEPGSRVAAKLEAAGIGDGSGELVIRRVIQSEGRSRAYLNGRLCTASQLLELAPDLCDIASQHESVSLTDPATHLEYLDAFGKLTSERIALEEAVDAAARATEELARACEAEKSRAEREDFLRFQLREIDELDPKANEEGDLENERGRLRHAEKLAGATRRAAERLYEGEGAMCDELGRLASEIDGAAALDGTLGPFARAIESARAELADAARALSRYADSVEASPDRLSEVDDRLFRLRKLTRRYGPNVDLRAQRDALATELDALASSQERRAALEGERTTLLAKAAETARSLSRKRCEAADQLADAIGRELAQLGMGRARVVVDVASSPASAGDALVVDGARLTRSGIDRVEFLIAPNPGEDPRPLRRIASGGELSRALLALKRVLAEKGPAGLYVFDEVDTGVGGAIAEVIGRAMADVSRHRQVVCVTHLPQIAALADTHFVVSKTEAKGRTVTSVRKLGTSERIDEVARMIGGLKVGDAARRAAEEMLQRPPPRARVRR